MTRLEEVLRGSYSPQEVIPPWRWRPEIVRKIPQVELYHATLSKNIPTILEKGIIPRTEEWCEKHIDSILGEYGLTRRDVDEWVWKSPLIRCKETTGRVSLSGNMQYAIGNCRAGKEAEIMLRSAIEKVPYDTVYRRLLEPCSMCIVDVPSDTMELIFDKPVGDKIREALEIFKKYDPKTTWEMAKEHFNEFRFPKIPREWIRECTPWGYEV